MAGRSMPIEGQIGERLRAQGLSVATAESCSGGLIAHRITNVSGSSAYFPGGVVSYSNEAKMEILGVKGASLEAHGAVSETVAREMAEGVRQRFRADLGLAVTGIAGPTGGTEDKPVGLVYMALASPGKTQVNQCRFSGSREEVKAQTAEGALVLLLEFLP